MAVLSILILGGAAAILLVSCAVNPPIGPDQNAQSERNHPVPTIGPAAPPVSQTRLKARERLLRITESGRRRLEVVAPPAYRARVLLEGGPTSDLDYTLSPDGTRLLAIEWHTEPPAPLRFYWARVVLFDLQRQTQRELFRPDEYPMLPVWIDDTHVAALLDGTVACVLDLSGHRPPRRIPVRGYRPSDGQFPNADAELPLRYLQALGRRAELKRTGRYLDKVRGPLGIDAWQNAMRTEISKSLGARLTGREEEERATLMVRAMGVCQFPLPWIYTDRGRVYPTEMLIAPCPVGPQVGYVAPADPASALQSELEVGIYDLVTRKRIARALVGEHAVYRLRWTPDGRRLVYSRTPSSDAPRGGIYALQPGASSGVLLGEGKNGQLARLP